MCRVRLGDQSVASADPVFIRLCQELVLTRRVERKIGRGVVAAEHLDEVRDLELCQEFR